MEKSSKKRTRPIAHDDIGQRPDLDRKLSEEKFSESLIALFPLMFGDRWAEFTTMRKFVEKFVLIDSNDKQILKKEGLMYATRHNANRGSRSQMLKAMLPDVLPEIEAKLKDLCFLEECYFHSAE